MLLPAACAEGEAVSGCLMWRQGGAAVWCGGCETFWMQGAASGCGQGSYNALRCLPTSLLLALPSCRPQFGQ
jgi:hypothetical protein